MGLPGSYKANALGHDTPAKVPSFMHRCLAQRLRKVDVDTDTAHCTTHQAEGQQRVTSHREARNKRGFKSLCNNWSQISCCSCSTPGSHDSAYRAHAFSRLPPKQNKYRERPGKGRVAAFNSS